jgi:ribose-phosphate pyrophosphokinase
MINDIALFTGNAHPELAASIAKHLGTHLSPAMVTKFSDGEIRVKIEEHVRSKDVFIIQPTCEPVNENLMELLIMIDALKRASSRRITAVLPYFGYSRQDRKDQPRVPITAKLVANLLTSAGVDRILMLDLHAAQIQGFFDIPADHLYAINTFVDYIKTLGISREKLCIVSPDVGGIKRARDYSRRLGAGLAIVDKRRYSPDSVESMNVLGDVKGKVCFMVDDIIATGSSLVGAANILKNNGAEEIYAAITHPVLSGNAVENIEKSDIKQLLITDSIPYRRQPSDKIKVISVAPLIADAIHRIHDDISISILFEV